LRRGVLHPLGLFVLETGQDGVVSGDPLCELTGRLGGRGWEVAALGSVPRLFPEVPSAKEPPAVGVPRDGRLPKETLSLAGMRFVLAELMGAAATFAPRGVVCKLLSCCGTGSGTLSAPWLPSEVRLLTAKGEAPADRPVLLPARRHF